MMNSIGSSSIIRRGKPIGLHCSQGALESTPLPARCTSGAVRADSASGRGTPGVSPTRPFIAAMPAGFNAGGLVPRVWSRTVISQIPLKSCGSNSLLPTAFSYRALNLSLSPWAYARPVSKGKSRMIRIAVMVVKRFRMASPNRLDFVRVPAT